MARLCVQPELPAGAAHISPGLQGMRCVFLWSEKSVANPYLAPSAAPLKQAHGNSGGVNSQATLAHLCGLPSFCQGVVGRRCWEASSDGVRRPSAPRSAGGAGTRGVSGYGGHCFAKIQKSHVKASAPPSCVMPCCPGATTPPS